MTKQEAKRLLDEFLAKKGETLNEHLLRTNPLYAKLKASQKETK